MSESLQKARARFSQPEPPSPEEVAEPVNEGSAWQVELGEDFKPADDLVRVHPGQIWENRDKTRVKVLRMQDNSRGAPYVVVEIKACPIAPATVGWETSYPVGEFPGGRKLVAIILDPGESLPTYTKERIQTGVVATEVEPKTPIKTVRQCFAIPDPTKISKKAKAILVKALEASPFDDQFAAEQDTTQKAILSAFNISPLLKDIL
jgi:hypothetical protein